MGERHSVSIAIVGSGGAGALTAGNLLLEAASAAGWQGLLSRTVGPQIRGGEAAALLRLGTQPVECLPEQFDLVVGIDWLNAHRFGAEIQAGPQTVVISDPRGGELPPAIAGAGARIFEVPMKDMAKTIPHGRGNMIALGIVGRLLGLGRAAARARAAELLSRFDLAEAAGRPVKTYSGGMRRRIDLAASLVGRPHVLFLDEPTTGLDPQARSDVWDMIRLLVADGVTVLLTTQYLDEADQLADDIVVIDHGRVIATGTPDELKAKVGGQVLEVVPADHSRLGDVAAALAAWTGSEPVTNLGVRRVTAQVASAAILPGIVRQLDESGIELAEFSLRKSSLDEVFLTLTGHRAEDSNGGPTTETPATETPATETPMTETTARATAGARERAAR